MSIFGFAFSGHPKLGSEAGVPFKGYVTASGKEVTREIGCPASSTGQPPGRERIKRLPFGLNICTLGQSKPLHDD
jgi:hypothetical protein